MTIQEIKQYMKDHKITQVQLSAKSGIPLVTINDIFRGQTKNPKLDTINSIMEALGLAYEMPSPVTILNYRTGYKNQIIVYNNSGDKFEFSFKPEQLNQVLKICRALSEE